MVAASLALLVVACGSGGATRQQGASPGQGGVQTTTHAHSSTTANATGVASAMLAQLFPRSGADWAAGTQFVEFMLGTRFKTETRCMAASGLPGPPTDLSSSAAFYEVQSYGSAEMPNLPLIERTKHLGDTIEIPSPSRSPAAALPKAEKTAYNAALKRCTAVPTRLFSFLSHGGAQALQQQWLNITAQVEAEPSVRAANRKAQRCSQGTGFSASSVENETSVIEGKSTPLNIKGERAQVKASEAKGVRVLVRCFGPAISLTTNLLTRRRAAFFDQNATALSQLQDDVNSTVAKIAQRYGLTPTAAEKPRQ